MTIYYDPSEARSSTRLHPSIIKVAKPLVGLETRTGADLMISGYSGLMPQKVLLTPAGNVMFPNFVQGSFLIQRKSRHDLLASIQSPGLLSILVRMQQHPASCWLMTTGRFTREGDDTYVDGRRTGMHWHGYKGALDTWQLSGGLVAQWDTDEEAAEWLLRWDKNMDKLKDSEYHVRPRHIAIHLRSDPRPWREVLEAFPEVGPVMSEAIADYCGDLRHSLMWMTDPVEVGVAGVGFKTKKIWRDYIGLADGEIMVPVDEDVAKVILQGVTNGVNPDLPQ